ncbi:MAG: MMPL family transporter, partial [Spirochaetota bacterium]
FNPPVSGEDKRRGQGRRWPPNRQTVTQYLALFSDDLEQFVQPDIYKAHNAKLSIYLNNGSKGSLQRVLGDIERYRAEHLPKGYRQWQSGYSLTVNRMNNLAVPEQIRSILIALLGVFLIVLCSLRSLRMALLACLPSTVTLLINLSLMALFRIDLNISTALINSLVIGVGIDYGIHLIAAYRRHSGEGAMLATLQQVSASILLNAIAVGLGYATLIFSQFRSLGYFGGLSALANIVAAVLTLLVLPMLLLGKKGLS